MPPNQPQTPPLTLKQIWSETLRKVIPWALCALIMVLSKASYDVYAFSKSSGQITTNIKENKNDIKLVKKDLNNLESKVDKILIGLCMMDEKTCRLQDNLRP